MIFPFVTDRVQWIINLQVPWLETCVVLVLALITIYRKQLSTNSEYRKLNGSISDVTDKAVSSNVKFQSTDVARSDMEHQTIEQSTQLLQATSSVENNDSSTKNISCEEDMSEYETIDQPLKPSISSTVNLLWRKFSETGEPQPVEAADVKITQLSAENTNAATTNSRAQLSELSEEVLFQISMYLDSESILKLSMSNRYLRQTLTSDHLWKDLFFLTFENLFAHSFTQKLLQDRDLHFLFSSKERLEKTCEQMMKRAGNWCRLCIVWEAQWQDWLCAGLCTTQRSLCAFDDRILDVSSFLSVHPGSAETLAEHCGAEVSDVFAEIGHSSEAISLQDKYLVFDAGLVSKRSPSRSVSQSLKDEFRQRQYNLAEENKLPLFALPTKHLLPQLYLQYQQQRLENVTYEVRMGRDGHTVLGLAHPIDSLFIESDNSSEESMATFTSAEENWPKRDEETALGFRNGLKLVPNLQYWDEIRCADKPPAISQELPFLTSSVLYLFANKQANAETNSNEPNDEDFSVNRVAGGFITKRLLALSKAIDLDLQPLFAVVAAASEHIEENDDPEFLLKLRGSRLQENDNGSNIIDSEASVHSQDLVTGGTSNSGASVPLTASLIRNVLPPTRSHFMSVTAKGTESLLALSSSVTASVSASVSGAMQTILTLNHSALSRNNSLNNNDTNIDDTAGHGLENINALIEDDAEIEELENVANDETLHPDVDVNDQEENSVISGTMGNQTHAIVHPMGEGIKWRSEHEGNCRVFFDPLRWQWTLWFACCGRAYCMHPLTCTFINSGVRDKVKETAGKGPLEQNNYVKPHDDKTTNTNEINSEDNVDKDIDDQSLETPHLENHHETNLAMARNDVDIEEEESPLSPPMSTAAATVQTEVLPGVFVTDLAETAAGSLLDPLDSLPRMASLPQSLPSLPSLSQSLSRRVTDALSLSRSASLTLASGLSQQLGDILHNTNPAALYNNASTFFTGNNSAHETRHTRLMKRLQREPFLAAMSLPELPQSRNNFFKATK